MQKHIVTIIHLILIAILLVAGLLLLVDMHHVNQRCTNQEIFSGQEEQEVIPQGSKPNSGKTAKSMREQAVMEMTKGSRVFWKKIFEIGEIHRANHLTIRWNGQESLAMNWNGSPLLTISASKK